MHDIESAIDIVNGHFDGAKAPVSQAAWFVCRAAIAEALKPSHNIRVMPLPTKEEVIIHFESANDEITTYGWYAKGINDCYDFIDRQQHNT